MQWLRWAINESCPGLTTKNQWVTRDRQAADLKSPKTAERAQQAWSNIERGQDPIFPEQGFDANDSLLSVRDSNGIDRKVEHAVAGTDTGGTLDLRVDDSLELLGAEVEPENYSKTLKYYIYFAKA